MFKRNKMQNLVIVESPTKARTLAKFLGAKYQIEASMGHVRDLPKSELGVDVGQNFQPKYIIPRDKKKLVNTLKKTASSAKNLYLATDPDREGEAIAWHIAELLRNSEVKSQKSKVKKEESQIKRVVFHEITEDAIKEAFKHPRDLDYKLIDAQQARRVLDRLVGYKLSPLLWKKVKRGLSAGRVQTVALRLVVEREKEVTAFKPVEYWSIEAELESRVKSQESRFIATLTEFNSKKLEIGNGMQAKKHVENLEKAEYSVSKVDRKEIKRYPFPPFTTSTLQQAAGNKLGFTAKKTMMLAQNLYEHGLITYMRTDSFNLSPVALMQSREFIKSQYGKNYLPPKPRVFKSRSKNAQEAHEAIRPTNIKFEIRNNTPASRTKFEHSLTRDHARLYDLIWQRMVASQMAEALVEQTGVDIIAVCHPRLDRGSFMKMDSRLRGNDSAENQNDKTYTLHAAGSVIKFDGWLKIYGISSKTQDTRDKKQEKEEEEEDEKNQILPELKVGEDLNLLQLLPNQHFTQPPPRYTESSLIKKLEELGIGRPSTYAPILSTIQERFYVEKQEKKFVPTALGLATCDFLIKYFPDVFDYQFTASMEDQLDDIAAGNRDWKQTLIEFYPPFEKKLAGVEKKAGKVKVAVEYAGKKCPKCGKELVVRAGRFGKFLACSGFPDCKHTESLVTEVINAKCPEDGGDIVIRKTKKRRVFYGCKNYPECKYASWTKPKS
ncbi:type I DNA topoisomerase [Candidatus Daviesbacteria bacterium]|nr:type I DNA topoisomerase [Candidatus Daviesbacteria bacterium]